MTQKDNKNEIEKTFSSLFQSDSMDSIINILPTMYNMDNIEMKTELSQNELMLIVKARLIQDIIKTEFDVAVDIENLIKDYMKLKVSNKRKGREEWFSAVKAEIERKSRTITDKLLARN